MLPVAAPRMARNSMFWNEDIRLEPGTMDTNHNRVQKHMTYISGEYELSANDPMPADYLEPIKKLWADSGVQKAILKGNEYALHDNLA